VPHADAPHVDKRRRGDVRALRASGHEVQAGLPVCARYVSAPGIGGVFFVYDASKIAAFCLINIAP